eukprot:gene21476-27298_t
MIETAKSIAETGSVTMTLSGEGELQDSLAVEVRADPNAQFRCADPMCLPAEWAGFDAVVLNDVIDKVPSPNVVLGRLGGPRGLVRSGGLLIVTSCFEWSSARTPQLLWLGGYKDSASGVEVESGAALVDRLKSDFNLLTRSDVPVLWLDSKRRCSGKLLE